MSESNSKSPSERYPRIYKYVKNRVQQQLGEYPAWPINILKLECENYGIYQDVTGRVINELEEHNEIDSTKESGHRYFTQPSTPTPKPNEMIKNAVSDLYDFTDNYSHFAELTAYVSLCKIYDETNISGMDVLPKGPRPHQLRGPYNELDCFVMLPNEYVPVEVYNGTKYLGDKGDKHKQCLRFSSDRTPMSNPLLINRRSDQKMKKSIRSKNGMVVDTGIMIGCKTAKSNLPDVLDLLNLDDIIHLIAPIETGDGVSLDGDEYHKIATNNEKAEMIRPSKMIPAAAELPEDYLKRIRGGVQLLYVNSFYRRSTDPMEKHASLVVQNIYNQLLREGGRDIQTVLDKGWTNVMDQYPRIKSAQQRKSAILDQTKRFISQLRQERVIIVRNGKHHARSSKHPQQSLSF